MTSVKMTVVSEHAGDDESAYSTEETGIQFSVAAKPRRSAAPWPRANGLGSNW